VGGARRPRHRVDSTFATGCQICDSSDKTDKASVGAGRQPSIIGRWLSHSPRDTGARTMNTQPASPGRKAFRWLLRVGLPWGGFIVALGAFFVTFAEYRHQVNQPNVSQEIAQAFASDSQVKIDPYPAGIPRCATLSGSAPVKDRFDLWIAHRTVGSDAFYLNQAHRDGSEPARWSMTATIGPTRTDGLSYEFFAFYAESDLSRFFDGIEARANDGSGGYFFVESLPPGVSLKPLATLARDGKRNSPCTN
jgi:hypothetical protein